LASQSILLTEFIGAVRVAGCNSTALESRGEKKEIATQVMMKEGFAYTE
jgi:hypothetical protein